MFELIGSLHGNICGSTGEPTAADTAEELIADEAKDAAKAAAKKAKKQRAKVRKQQAQATPDAAPSASVHEASAAVIAAAVLKDCEVKGGTSHIATLTDRAHESPAAQNAAIDVDRMHDLSLSESCALRHGAEVAPALQASASTTKIAPGVTGVAAAKADASQSGEAEFLDQLFCCPTTKVSLCL